MEFPTGISVSLGRVLVGFEVGLRWGLWWPMRKKSPFGIKKIKKNVAFEPFLRLLN